MSIFYFIAFLSILFALLVISAKNPVHSVLYLILTFFTFHHSLYFTKRPVFGHCKLYCLHGCHYGTVPFVLMLLNLNKESEPAKSIYGKNSAVLWRWDAGW
jgi:NADH-quinone oxidoreductase subunit J